MSEAEVARLEFHYVAFLDLLGFSSMVKQDCHSPPEQATHLERLKSLHLATREKLGAASEFTLSQFSDSVVLAAPYSASRLPRLVELLKGFQWDLLEAGILCRGGVAVGKHFSERDFLFSEGLIDAYNLERTVARYPRVVLSSDLMQLAAPSGEALAQLPLLRQEDEAVFVDFLAGADLSRAIAATKKITGTHSRDASVREKHRWLSEYLDFKCQQAGIEAKAAQPRFREV